MSDIAPHAVVTCGATWVLHVGDDLAFGRAAENLLRIGPDEPRISRTAGRLECRADGLLIRNLSTKRGLCVRTYPGPDQVIKPRQVRGWDFTRFTVWVEGVPEPRIDVRTVGLGGEAPPRPGPGATIGFDRIPLRRRHRRLLAALCLPPMTATGAAAEVPTVEGVQQILVSYRDPLSVHTVRNNLNHVREILRDQHGVEGLFGDPVNAFRPLAEWAMASGNVTEADLDALDLPPDEGPDT
ncbi:hypothetical protein [Pseudonocardia pini]|uniref:hypothetical protein n=1 Tax=Pseudonocardia pini TaxID=2758030 RepID=UPI0015F0163C|nr:hypothetical protein [Pseudonocardia pini]